MIDSTIFVTVRSRLAGRKFLTPETRDSRLTLPNAPEVILSVKFLDNAVRPPKSSCCRRHHSQLSFKPHTLYVFECREEFRTASREKCFFNASHFRLRRFRLSGKVPDYEYP